MCNYITLIVLISALLLTTPRVYARTLSPEEFGVGTLPNVEGEAQPLPTVPDAISKHPNSGASHAGGQVYDVARQGNSEKTNPSLYRDLHRTSPFSLSGSGNFMKHKLSGYLLPDGLLSTRLLISAFGLPGSSGLVDTLTPLYLLRDRFPAYRTLRERILQYLRTNNPSDHIYHHDNRKNERSVSAHGIKPDTPSPRIHPLLPAGASVFLPPALGVPLITGALFTEQIATYSRFASNPFGDDIPTAVKEVYTWDQLWHPAYNPQHYLQCTAYVAMVYNMNGISLKGKVYGDARTWIRFDDVFAVHASGSSTDPPRPLDVAVWAANDDNHVGVVIEATPDRITVANANATHPEYEFRITYDDEKKITITNDEGESAADAWVPSHWLRYDQQ
ncbi:MAG: CHAP domain-containing protein [Patescibacteria group bacterium]|nr:CHAP domain-containing protein [Patescibacteria group bacterium]